VYLSYAILFFYVSQPNGHRNQLRNDMNCFKCHSLTSLSPAAVLMSVVRSLRAVKTDKDLS